MPAKESKYFLNALLVLFLALFILILAGFLAPLVLGLLLAGLGFPLYRELSKKIGDKKNLAALITVFAIALVIILPFLGVLSLLAKEAFDIFTTARDQWAVDQSFMQTLEPIAQKLNLDLGELIRNQLAPIIENIGLTISREIGGLLSDALRLALNFFVMIVTTFYLLRDGEKLANFLIKLSPLKTSDELSLYHTFREAGKAVFFGNFISAIVQGLLGGLGFLIFGIGSPVLWGTVMAFLALIPFLGPYLIFLPAAIYLFISGDALTAILFLLYNILIVSTVDNLIKPKLISDRIKIHPFLILLSILGGIKVFGLLGIIYGPLIAAVFLALLKVYLEHVGANPHLNNQS